MKTPETVTLIDLEGKPIELFKSNCSLLNEDVKDKIVLLDVIKNKPIIYFEYLHAIINTIYYQDDTVVSVDLCRNMYPFENGSLKGEYDRQEGIQLKNLINDQLTFIRNGMWETLAIYQTTLGRYWEVPWYNSFHFNFDLPIVYELCETARHDYISCKKDRVGKLVFVPCNRHGYPIGDDVLSESKFVKQFSRVRPSANWFLSHYHKVFSKLTPYEGESPN